MFRNIVNTFSTKLLLQGVSFLLIILTANLLGADGRGEISYFVANMTLVVLFNNLIGGSAIVYLTPRSNVWSLVLPAYIWAAFGSVVSTLFLFAVGKVPEVWLIHLAVISFVNTALSTNLFAIQGKEYIKKHNLLALMQVLILAATWLVIYFILELQTPISFIYALYVSVTVSFVLSCIVLVGFKEPLSLQQVRSDVRALIKYGFMAQLSNIIMFFSYRLTYYFLGSTSELGVYSVAVQLSEAVWIIGRSLAMVQFSRISNATHADYKVKLTLRLIKTGTALTLVAVCVLLCIPAVVYEWAMGEAFGAIAELLWWLAPGIVSIAMISSITPYYGGTGRYGENIAAATVGLVLTVLGCYLIIPRWGVVGAALVTSLAYTGITLFLLIRFYLHTGFSWGELLLRRSDVVLFTKFLKRF